MPTVAPSRAALASLICTALAAASCGQEIGLSPFPPTLHPEDVTECGFTPISGTQFSRYDCNPVFTGPVDTWGTGVGSIGFHTTEILGHPFYQMWYTARPRGAGFGEWALGYAVSGNGTEWEAHHANPLMEAERGEWDSDSLAGQVVVWDPDTSQYVMAFQGFTLRQSAADPGIWGLGIATSPDGIRWSKLPNNPVINFDEVEGDIRPCWPLTMTKTPEGFRGYLAAGHAGEAQFGDHKCEIYAMSAEHPSRWEIHPRPVLTGDNWYETEGVVSASVAELNDVQYMFYIGFEDWIPGVGFRSATIRNFALATSTDGGQSWNKESTNPIPLNLTSPGRMSAVGARVVGPRIHLWITDYYEELDQQAVGYFLFEPDVDPHP
ncbi:MAG: hypothetical protein EA397_08595 [Deltaproteobacteria bacterium]|nr:MAG: hypothetical protein EA397_08595 [Deltaproteobacteria bacterium]